MIPHVLVVEDEDALAQLLKYNLEKDGYRVSIARDGEEALVIADEIKPDLVLLDWMLPGRSGIALARQLRENKRTKFLPIIFLTARSEEHDKVAALETGVDDYVTKPFSTRELVARIKAVLRRRAPHMTDDSVLVGDLRLDPATHRVTGNGQLLELGPVEFRLLHYLMTHPERVHSRKQLLDEVWGDHVFVEERTVDVHIRRLRVALTPSGNERLIETVRGSGYRMAQA